MVAEWQAGTLYIPGDLVRPVGKGNVTQSGLTNGDFETGDLTGWTLYAGGGTYVASSGDKYAGTYSARFTDSTANSSLVLVNDDRIACIPGQTISASCYAKCVAGNVNSRFNLQLRFYNSGGTLIRTSGLPLNLIVIGPYGNEAYPYSNSDGLIGLSAYNIWKLLTSTTVVPENAATFSIGLAFTWFDTLGDWYIDEIELDYAAQASPVTHLFRATQADAGYSDTVEPDWPTVLGNTVVDNEVTWTAVEGNNITWEANRILVSSASEPTWPTEAQGTVVDGTISWILDPRQVTDEHVPNSGVVLIAAGKVYAAEGDIIDYSATVNPLDWSTADDAGFIAAGLQMYGANDIAAIGLYRGNLIAFNSQGAQIWQVDEDPAAINFLDAVPIPCTYPKTVQPVGEDLAFLCDLGARSLGMTGATVNMQAGYFGKPIDPLVLAALAAAELADVTPRALYWPAAGQYWLIFGLQAFVLTINGTGQNDRSWSRYTFPSAIDDWTILGTDLYLRSGDLIWKVDDDLTVDDYRIETSGGEMSTDFQSAIQWPHLDFGRPGVDKELVEFDLSFTGTVNVTFGWDQTDQDYSSSGAWTTLHELTADTMPGGRVPFSMTAPSFAMRLVPDANQAWEFHSANLYIEDRRAG